MSRILHLHLVSPVSGELLELLARNVVAQLAGATPERQLWPLVRTPEQVAPVLAGIAATPGFVLHTLADPEVRGLLEDGCERLAVPYRFVLAPFVEALAEHFDVDVAYRAGVGHLMDDAYFRRLDAMRFTLAHDDGQRFDELEEADVVLIGASRVTKTPTCMYLANRGVRAANVPLVPGIDLPDAVIGLKRPLVVGLTIDPSVLVAIREERERSLGKSSGRARRSTAYADPDAVSDELRQARRLYLRHGWTIIDVSHRSIEQTAAIIIDRLNKRQAAAPAAG
jgi:hypothetical protein